MIEFKVEITFAGHLFTFFSSACYGEVYCVVNQLAMAFQTRKVTYFHPQHFSFVTHCIFLTVLQNTFSIFHSISLKRFKDLSIMSYLYHLVIRKYRNQKAYLLRYSLVPCIFQGYAVRPGKQTWVSYIDGSLLCRCFQCCSQSLVCSATFHCNGVSGWASTPPSQLISWGVFELFPSPRET